MKNYGQVLFGDMLLALRNKHGLITAEGVLDKQVNTVGQLANELENMLAQSLRNLSKEDIYTSETEHYLTIYGYEDGQIVVSSLEIQLNYKTISIRELVEEIVKELYANEILMYLQRDCVNHMGYLLLLPLGLNDNNQPHARDIMGVTEIYHHLVKDLYDSQSICIAEALGCKETVIETLQNGDKLSEKKVRMLIKRVILDTL